MLIKFKVLNLFSDTGIENSNSNISKVTLSIFCPRVYLFDLGNEVITGVNSL